MYMNQIRFHIGQILRSIGEVNIFLFQQYGDRVGYLAKYRTDS